MEKRIVVFELRLHYTGPFHLDDFYKEIDEWMASKGLTKDIKRKSEHILPKGKKVEWTVEMWKSVSHPVKHTIRLRSLFNNVKEHRKKIGEKSVRFQQGDALMVIDGFVETDVNSAWTMNPLFVFFRTLYDKYVWNVYFNRYEGDVSADCYDLHKRLKSFFSLYKMKIGQ